MRTLKISTLIMALVAIMSTLSLANPAIESISIGTDSSGAKIYVLVTQDVVDSLRQAGNPTAAFQVLDLLRESEKQTADSLAARKKVVDDSLAAAQQALDDSLAAAEERKNFWPNVQKATTEIPVDFDSILYWADTPVKIAAVLLTYDIPRSWIDDNISNIDGYGEELITAAAMNYAQTRQLLRHYAVELNGPAHRRLMGQDSLLSQDLSAKADLACLEETNASLTEAREAVELTFEMATTNTGNIQLLATEVDGLKRSVWTCLEGLKRTKIRNNQGDDNRKMMESLTVQAKTASVPIELKKSTEL